MFCFFATDALANQAVITTTDYSSGSFSSLDLATNTATNDHLTIHSDAVVRTYRDKVYIINRLGQDNVLVLDQSDLKTPLTQYSTGNGSNPHDMAFVSEEKAYISRYEHTHLLIVNPVTGDSLGEVDLSVLQMRMVCPRYLSSRCTTIICLRRVNAWIRIIDLCRRTFQ